MAYQCVATSVAGFVQQLAVAYVANDYFFYVTGNIPPEKDPSKTDVKIQTAYGIAVSKFTRSRRKKSALANVQYLRYRNFFIIIATGGYHKFFADESSKLLDIRRHPLSFMGYSIGYRRAFGRGLCHASVRIHADRYTELKQHLGGIAVQRTTEELCGEFARLPFEPYAPVRNQFFALLRLVNRKRAVAGLERVPVEALRLRRSPVRPFATSELSEDCPASTVLKIDLCN